MRHLSLLAAAVLWSAGAAAAPVPRLDELSPSERPVVVNGLALMARGGGGPKIEELDTLLASVPGPTKARGLIQMMRAGVLSNTRRQNEAQLAIEESIRLLPEHSAPLFTASEIMTFGRTPGAAADYLIRASRIDPELAAELPTYNIFNLLGRLRHAGDLQRSEALTDRLVQINWAGDDLDGRSSLVREAILIKLKRKDVAGARALVSELLDPADQYGLLSQKVAEPIWSDIEAWSGPALEKQWPVYLREARRRFKASSDPEAAGDYLDALTKARKDASALTELLPVFTAGDLGAEDGGLSQKVGVLAGVLGRLGRFDEMEQMYAKLETIWPLGSSTNALNLTANHARWLLIRGEKERSLAMIDRTIAEADKAGSEVNGDALAAMHQLRACVLASSGRREEAATSAAFGALAINANPAGVIRMHLCMGAPDKAKVALLAALENEVSRPGMIVSLQPSNGRPAPTPFAVAEEAAWDKLRTDREVMAALKRNGRMLGFALGDGAPAVLPD